MEICGASNKCLLIFFCLSSVDDEHNVGNSHTGLSNVRGQDNLKQRQNGAIFRLIAAKYRFTLVEILTKFLFISIRQLSIFMDPEALFYLIESILLAANDLL